MRPVRHVKGRGRKAVRSVQAKNDPHVRQVKAMDRQVKNFVYRKL
jgi:hypothetical protein